MNHPIRLVVIGSSGRMGAAIYELAPALGFEIAAGVSRSGLSLSQVRPENCDVVIDFSLPEMTKQVVDWCVSNRKPLVSGVTGLSEDDHQALRAGGKEIPLLWSPNMSVGVAILSRVLRRLGPLSDFQFQLEEVHHRHKKDAPSGTAKALQGVLEETLGRSLPPPVSIRGGGVVGIHKISALGEEEVLSFEHTALDRRVFARGSLRAARWLMGREPGFYHLDDTL